jgi:hypothetical protein
VKSGSRVNKKCQQLNQMSCHRLNNNGRVAQFTSWLSIDKECGEMPVTSGHVMNMESRDIKLRSGHQMEWDSKVMKVT